MPFMVKWFMSHLPLWLECWGKGMATTLDTRSFLNGLGVWLFSSADAQESVRA